MCERNVLHQPRSVGQFKFSGVKDWSSEAMLIKEDNQGVIKIATGEVKHKHQKHILLRLAFVRESIQSN